jgi:hypothetical protein
MGEVEKAAKKLVDHILFMQQLGVPVQLDEDGDTFRLTRELSRVLPPAPKPKTRGEEIAEAAVLPEVHGVAVSSGRQTFRSHDGVSRAFAVETLAQIIDKAIAEERRACEMAAAIHCQYPISTDFDHGYAQGRKDASKAIAVRK